MQKNEEKKDVKRDTLFDGALICSQYQDGYRFSIDAILLAHFVEVQTSQRILDLGTGSGIICLILLYLHGEKIQECSGVEIQPGLIDLAAENIRINGFANKNSLFHCDVKNIRKYIAAETYDCIVCNPPFYPESSGRKSGNTQCRIARHQITAKTQDFLAAAAYAVRNKGDVCFIYPAHLFADFTLAAKTQNLTLKAARFIYSYPESDRRARLVLIKCSKNGGSGLEIKPPLYIYKEKNGEYSQEVCSFYNAERDTIF